MALVIIVGIASLVLIVLAAVRNHRQPGDQDL
jgi:hypothetical protein